MTRSWFVVHGADLVVNPKWRETGSLERGALATLWVAGSVKEREANWPTIEEVARVLRADGYPEGTAEALVSLGWLDVADDGSVTVHEWTHWQKPLPRTDAERSRTYRDRHEPSRDPVTERDASRTDDDAPTSVTDVTERHDFSSPLLLSPVLSGEGSGEGDEPVNRCLRWLAGHGCLYLSPGSRLYVELEALVALHGDAPVLRVWERIARQGISGDAGRFIWGARDALTPKPDIAAIRAEEAEERDRKASARRQAATRRLIDEYREATQ